MPVTEKDYESLVENQWCPGCGNFGILTAVKKTLVELQLPPDRVVIASGIGQGPKLPHYLHVNTFNGLHGREVPSAEAIKLAADDLTVIVSAGDGGAYAEGGNHFTHAIRRNIDMTLLVHDNFCYGLTKGQPSPTTEHGAVTKITPDGVAADPLNPLALAISQGCSFVAQGMSARTDHLVDILKKAILHKGFSFVNIYQPCVTWDRVHTYQYYKEHCYELGPEYDPRNQMKALELVLTPSDKHPLGVIYENDRTTYESQVLAHIPHPLRDQPVDPKLAVSLYEEFI
jgi:2-oxoglutarate ferredoxin oxidoreductase subunit beta